MWYDCFKEKQRCLPNKEYTSVDRCKRSNMADDHNSITFQNFIILHNMTEILLYYSILMEFHCVTLFEFSDVTGILLHYINGIPLFYQNSLMSHDKNPFT